MKFFPLPVQSAPPVIQRRVVLNEDKIQLTDHHVFKPSNRSKPLQLDHIPENQHVSRNFCCVGALWCHLVRLITMEHRAKIHERTTSPTQILPPRRRSANRPLLAGRAVPNVSGFHHDGLVQWPGRLAGSRFHRRTAAANSPCRPSRLHSRRSVTAAV